MEKLKDDFICFIQSGTYCEVILRKADISFIEILDEHITVNTYNGTFFITEPPVNFLRRLGWLEVV